MPPLALSWIGCENGSGNYPTLIPPFYYRILLHDGNWDKPIEKEGENVNSDNMTPAARGVRNLEQLVNGKATINDLRKEAGLAPIEGGDELLVKRDTVVISAHDDVVFVMGKDGKSGKVAVLQAGVLIPAQIWTTRDWGRYIARRIASSAKGHFMGLALLEKEKEAI